MQHICHLGTHALIRCHIVWQTIGEDAHRGTQSLKSHTQCSMSGRHQWRGQLVCASLARCSGVEELPLLQGQQSPYNIMDYSWRIEVTGVFSFTANEIRSRTPATIHMCQITLCRQQKKIRLLEKVRHYGVAVSSMRWSRRHMRWRNLFFMQEEKNVLPQNSHKLGEEVRNCFLLQN